MTFLKHPIRIAAVGVALIVAAVLVAVVDQDSGGVSGGSDRATPAPTVSSTPATDVATTAAVREVTSSRPRCFGAASMAKKRCHNPALVGKVTPKPKNANRDQPRTPGKQCYRSGTSQTRVNQGCTFGKRAKNRPHVILVGDSHARALMPVFITMARQRLISLEVQVRGACSWTRSGIDHPDRSRIKPCRTYRKNLSKWLVKQAPRTDMIVTTGYVRQIAGGRKSQVKKMRAMWRPLIKRGVRIVAVSDNPRLPRDPQRCLKKNGARKGAKTCGVPAKSGLVRDPFLRTAKSTKGATAINLRSRFCRKGHCPAVIGGVNVYRDRTHVTTTYARTLTPVVKARMRAKGLL